PATRCGQFRPELDFPDLYGTQSGTDCRYDRKLPYRPGLETVPVKSGDPANAQPHSRGNIQAALGLCESAFGRYLSPAYPKESKGRAWPAFHPLRTLSALRGSSNGTASNSDGYIV